MEPRRHAARSGITPPRETVGNYGVKVRHVAATVVACELTLAGRVPWPGL